jgi:hypothetical protein
MTQFPNIPGADKLVEWLQGQPSFHDAEVMELHLDRARTSWLLIMTVYKPAVVRFTLEDVVDLELADFSSQNVIAGMDLEKKGDYFRLTLYPCFGIAGFIEAKHIAVEIVPRA